MTFMAQVASSSNGVGVVDPQNARVSESQSPTLGSHSGKIIRPSFYGAIGAIRAIGAIIDIGAIRTLGAMGALEAIRATRAK